MNDEKGQLSGEYLLLIGSLITVLMISAFLIGNENELNIAMAAAKSGVSEGVASSSSAIYPKETFNEYDNMDGLKHPYSVSVLNISYNSSGIDKNYGKQKIQFKVYAKASQDYNKKELDSNVEQVLRDVNLYENRNDKVKSFSGGMKQRLGIAITCVANPEIIIFDEPTVGLDPEERARFKNLIRKLSKTKTIVLSTHILSDVEEVADYIILIKEGCLTKFEKIGGKDNE